MKYNPWFEPLGRRLLTLGLALAWLALETWGGDFGLWFWLAVAATAFTVWEFFLRQRYGGGASTDPAQS